MALVAPWTAGARLAYDDLNSAAGMAWTTDTDYTAWNNVTLGTGYTSKLAWRWHGTALEVIATLTLGTGGSVSGLISVDLPNNVAADLPFAPASVLPVGIARMAVGNNYEGPVHLVNATTDQLQVRRWTWSGSNITSANTSATQPGTWAAGHTIDLFAVVPAVDS